MKKYLVVCFDDANDSYVVNDLDSLINEMYVCELNEGESIDEVNNKFYAHHKVFEINGEIIELN